MKVLATARIENEKTVGFLVKAFFRAYKAENILYLKGKEVKFQMELEGIEQEDIDSLAETISHCEVIELQHGDISLLKTKETSEADNDEKKKDPDMDGTEVKPEKETLMENFEGIATSSSSYEEFKNNVLKELRMSDALKEIFAHLLEAAEEAEEINWKNIKQIYDKRYDKSLKSQRWNLQAKVKKITGLGVIEFLAAIVNHKNDSYESQNIVGDNSSDITKDSDNQGNMKVTSTDCINSGEYNGVQMLSDVIDKTQSLEERVDAVLSEMQHPTDQLQKDAIQKMVEKLITQPVIDLAHEDMETRMSFANMVNVFMKKHGRKTLIKAKEFLQELQAVILTDEEQERYKIGI